MAEYIEREAAIDCLHFVCVPQCRKYAQEEIKKIPAADVAPVRQGKWIPHQETLETTVYAGGKFYAKGDAILYGYVCSECGRWEGQKEPFCNCGAKMEDDENGDIKPEQSV